MCGKPIAFIQTIFLCQVSIDGESDPHNHVAGNMRAIEWELINDLQCGITVYASFNNQPQTEIGSTSDYSVNTTLTY